MCGCRVHFFFPSLFPPSPLRVPYPLSMEEPTSGGTPPRVTRRGTSQGDHPPPQDFDRGWSSLRWKKSTAGVCFAQPPPPLRPLPPLPHLSLPAPLPITYLRACFVLPSHNFRVGSTTHHLDRFVGNRNECRCVHAPFPHPFPPEPLSSTACPRDIPTLALSFVLHC